MSVYVDKLRGTMLSGRWLWAGSCHMIADSVEELHLFADSIRLKRVWFQPHSSPHYDLTPNKRAAAVRRGALELSSSEFVAILRRLRKGVEVSP